MIFSHVVAINLNRRADRWNELLPVCRRAGIPTPRRFEAVDALTDVTDDEARHVRTRSMRVAKGRVACGRSHTELITDLIRRGVLDDGVLVIEDDVRFADRFAEKLEEWEPELPADWSFIHLGPRHRPGPPPVPFSEHWARPVHVLYTHAYVLRGEPIARLLLGLWKPPIRDAIDQIWNPDINQYAIVPITPLAGQSASRSDIGAAVAKNTELA